MLCCAVWNTVAVVPILIIVPWYLPAGNNTTICRQPTLLSQYCRYYILGVLSMSSDFYIIYVKRFQRRYGGQPAPHSIAPTGGLLLLLLLPLLLLLLLLYKYMQIFIPSRYPGTMTVYFKVLGSQCLCSMCYCFCCCVPEIHAYVPKLC